MMKRILFDAAVAGNVGGGAASTVTAPAATPAPVAAGAATWMTPPVPANGGSATTGGTPVVPAAPITAPAAPAAVPAAPVKYTLNAPKGSTLEAAALEKYASHKLALGLTQEQAQKLLESDHNDRVAADAAFQEQIRTSIVKNNETWAAELQKKHGDKFGELSEHAKRALDHADPKGTLRAAMEKAGVSHYPELVEAFATFGRDFLADDKLHAPSAGVTGGQKKTPIQVLTEEFSRKK